MDDLDDLLDEIEAEFSKASVKGAKKSGIERNSNNNGALPTKSTKKSTKDDIDDLLDDIDGHSVKTIKKNDHLLPPTVTKPLSRTPTPNSTKCYPVYLSGSNVATGQGSSLNQLPCDQLRCTECDFRIVLFDDYQWHKTVDYLFLRNNVPDFNKLKAKLRQKKDSRAYACQCCWRNVTSLTNLQSDRELKWVCSGRH